MKGKKAAVWAVSALLILVLAGCGTDMNTQKEGTDLSLSMPDSYQIEMTVRDRGTVSHLEEYAITVCEEGVYLYIGDTGNKYVFESIGDGKYIQYQKGKRDRKYTTPNIPDSLWDQINKGNVPISSVASDWNMINGLSSVFTLHLNSYESVRASLRYAGKETVAGWECEKYTMEVRHFSGRTVNEYWIEPDTGVCLKLVQKFKSLFFKNERTVECTLFRTGDVSLPDYK